MPSPLLRHFRKLVHTACPEVKEDIKWSFPYFTYKGNLCFMASFKAHCGFGFWAREIEEKIGQRFGNPEAAVGHMGRITQLSDLPKDALLLDLIREAVALNEAGKVTRPRPVSKEKKPLVVPSDFAALLRKNKKANERFETMSYSHRKEYLEWISEAKRDETRLKRISTTLAWLEEGKSRNWKYETGR